MLTSEERARAVARMRVYPPGVPANAWGFGPMAEADEDGDFTDPTNFSDEEREEFG